MTLDRKNNLIFNKNLATTFIIFIGLLLEANEQNETQIISKS